MLPKYDTCHLPLYLLYLAKSEEATRTLYCSTWRMATSSSLMRRREQRPTLLKSQFHLHRAQHTNFAIATTRQGRRCSVIGGGQVHRRRQNWFLALGAGVARTCGECSLPMIAHTIGEAATAVVQSNSRYETGVRLKWVRSTLQGSPSLASNQQKGVML